jgi:hypothetical protein
MAFTWIFHLAQLGFWEKQRTHCSRSKSLSTEMKGTPNMKDFTILVAVAIFGQIVAFTIAANFSEHLSEDADTLAQEEGADQIAPSATDISSIPTAALFRRAGIETLVDLSYLAASHKCKRSLHF